jgi:hypothetical protein
MNNIIGENDVMDANTLPQVKMPNRTDSIRCSRTSISSAVPGPFNHGAANLRKLG